MECFDVGEVVVGDGGFLFCMEKWGYVKVGVWILEVIVEYLEVGNDFFIMWNVGVKIMLVNLNWGLIYWKYICICVKLID